MKVCIFFSINNAYIDVAKVFFKSFFQFNKEDIYDFRAYSIDDSFNSNELMYIPRLSFHKLECREFENVKNNDINHSSKFNTVFPFYTQILDEILAENKYDLIIHADLDMIFINSIYKDLEKLYLNADKWQIASALENLDTYKTYYKTTYHKDCPYCTIGNHKCNFGFVVFNPKTVYRDNFNKFVEWEKSFNTAIYNPDEMFISEAYPYKINLNDIVYLSWQKDILDNIKIIHFAGDTENKPFNKLNINLGFTAITDWGALYLYFAKTGNCSKAFIDTVEQNLLAINPKLNLLYEHTGVSTYEKKLLKHLAFNDVFVFKPQPVTERAQLKSCVFACTCSYNYLDATFITLYSMFQYNEIPLVHVYFLNETEEHRIEAEKKLQQISKNIKVIPYTYHSNRSTYLHFKREFVDSKMGILDELTPQFKYTVMFDCDLLIQGNFKSLLPAISLCDGKIFGVKDICLIDKGDIRTSSYDRYINAGFVVYKQGFYDFAKRYEVWAEQHLTTEIGKLNEQDFINDLYQKDVRYIQPTWNYNVFLVIDTYLTQPNIIHFLGGSKPYLNVDNVETNWVSESFYATERHLTVIRFYSLYYCYVDKLKEFLTKEFVDRCEQIKNSKELNDCKELFMTVINGI